MPAEELLSVLRELVEAIDLTHWSSWQTTAKFDGPLQNARDAIARARADEERTAP
jgi:hypothetical protein